MNNPKLLSIALAIFILLASGAAFPASMDEEIDFLLDTVADSDCTFTRNGKDHAAADARDHLQMKRKRGARYFDSSDEFIDKIASESSWSGKPYYIQCDNELRVTAKEWFSALLENHRKKNPQ